MELGGGFWLAFIAGAIGLAIAGFCSSSCSRRLDALGLPRRVPLLRGVLILFGWIYDKRDKRRRESLEAEMAPVRTCAQTSDPGTSRARRGATKTGKPAGVIAGSSRLESC